MFPKHIPQRQDICWKRLNTSIFPSKPPFSSHPPPWLHSKSLENHFSGCMVNFINFWKITKKFQHLQHLQPFSLGAQGPHPVLRGGEAFGPMPRDRHTGGGGQAAPDVQRLVYNLIA
jgi:hypothetical protein